MLLLNAKASQTLKLPLKSSRVETNPLSLFKFWSSTYAIEQINEDKKKKEHTQNSRTMSTDLNDYKIIKEGEAEILMHAKNEVFYNKAQVRDLKLGFFCLCIHGLDENPN